MNSTSRSQCGLIVKQAHRQQQCSASHILLELDRVPGGSIVPVHAQAIERVNNRNIEVIRAKSWAGDCARPNAERCQVEYRSEWVVIELAGPEALSFDFQAELDKG